MSENLPFSLKFALCIQTHHSVLFLTSIVINCCLCCYKRSSLAKESRTDAQFQSFPFDSYSVPVLDDATMLKTLYDDAHNAFMACPRHTSTGEIHISADEAQCKTSDVVTSQDLCEKCFEVALKAPGNIRGASSTSSSEQIETSFSNGLFSERT